MLTFEAATAIFIEDTEDPIHEAESHAHSQNQASMRDAILVALLSHGLRLYCKRRY
jgi:hypothetical protein